jgi:hypothetical protein
MKIELTEEQLKNLEDILEQQIEKAIDGGCREDYEKTVELCILFDFSYMTATWEDIDDE